MPPWTWLLAALAARAVAFTLPERMIGAYTAGGLSAADDLRDVKAGVNVLFWAFATMQNNTFTSTAVLPATMAAIHEQRPDLTHIICEPRVSIFFSCASFIFVILLHDMNNVVCADRD